MTMNWDHRWLWVSAVCAGVLSLAASPLAAQSNSMFGSNSVSNRGSSSSSSGMGGFGNSGFGSQGGGSGSGGLGGLGAIGGLGGLSQGGFGGAGGNRGGAGGNTGSAFGNNQGANQGGFIGRNADPSQFIGLNTLTGGNQGQLNSGRRNSQGGLGNRNTNLNGMQNLNPANSGQNQAPSLRARQKVAFEYPKRQPAQVQTAVRLRIGKVPPLKHVTLSVDDEGAIVLSGEVASESAARMAEKLVRLEPGVKSVRSELTFPAPNAD